MSEYKLGPVETKFAEIIWNNEPVSSSQLAKICLAELEWKKSTTYTVLRKLCEQGIFQNKDGVITVLITKENFIANRTENFIEETFDGSLPAFLARTPNFFNCAGLLNTIWSA